jgi:hypothetical protein
VRWGVDAILTDVTKTWLDMRAALNGTRGRGEITLRADGQFRRLRQSLRTAQALLPLDLALVLFGGPVWPRPLIEAQDREVCGLV